MLVNLGLDMHLLSGCLQQLCAECKSFFGCVCICGVCIIMQATTFLLPTFAVLIGLPLFLGAEGVAAKTMQQACNKHAWHLPASRLGDEWATGCACFGAAGPDSGAGVWCLNLCKLCLWTKDSWCECVHLSGDAELLKT